MAVNTGRESTAVHDDRPSCFQTSLVVWPDELPVMYERFLPDSHVTFLELSFFTYLYSKALLFGTITDLLQVGYDAGDSGIASAVFQEPSEAIEPTT